METLRTLLKAYLDNSLTTDQFADQFIDFWNEIRIEQNKAIEASGIRETLDTLWHQYKTGDIDEVDYGMQWTETLTKLKNVRIPPQSITYTIGNKIYSTLTLRKEREHLEKQDIPTVETIREHVQHLLDAIDH